MALRLNRKFVSIRYAQPGAVLRCDPPFEASGTFEISPFPTPRIDKLASEGLRLTNMNMGATVHAEPIKHPD